MSAALLRAEMRRENLVDRGYACCCCAMSCSGLAVALASSVQEATRAAHRVLRIEAGIVTVA